LLSFVASQELQSSPFYSTILCHLLQVEIRSFQEEDFKETLVSLTGVFKGDGVPFGRENAE
jgi:hypothetical protein